MTRQLITMDFVDVDTFEDEDSFDIIQMSTVKEGDRFMCSIDGGVMWHEDTELVDATDDVMSVPFNEDPEASLSLCYVAGEFRVYDENMKYIDNVRNIEDLEDLLYWINTADRYDNRRNARFI